MPAAGRLDLHIVARFLGRMAEPGAGGFSKSQLQRAVRLNYDLFTKYLDALIQRQLVESRASSKGTFGITAEGRRVHDELVQWLEDLFGSA